jgi:hypothetical protein
MPEAENINASASDHVPICIPSPFFVGGGIFEPGKFALLGQKNNYIL